MNRDKPGMLDSLREAASILAKSLEGPVNAMMDAFYGVDVRVSASVKRGTSYYSDRHGETNRRVLFMHPLDALFIDYKGEPSAHLEEALGWIFERAAVRLDEVVDDAGIMARVAAERQEERMKAWMRENGVSQHRLEAARALYQHRGITRRPPAITLDDLTEMLEARG